MRFSSHNIFFRNSNVWNWSVTIISRLMGGDIGGLPSPPQDTLASWLNRDEFYFHSHPVEISLVQDSAGATPRVKSIYFEILWFIVFSNLPVW